MSRIKVRNVLPNPDQPRVLFDQEELENLAASMKTSGLIQPITVDRKGEKYVLVDGERRWRAAQLLEWEYIEAFIRQDGHLSNLCCVMRSTVYGSYNSFHQDTRL